MVNELKAIVDELGGERVLGRHLASDRDLREAIREGFRPAVVEELMRASGLTLKELARFTVIFDPAGGVRWIAFAIAKHLGFCQSGYGCSC